jgi:ATP-dependent RNA helicase DDX52/ROK1
MKIAKNFDKSCNILITTPNRLIFLLKDENIKRNLKSTEWLLVDEADKLFEEGQNGFRDQVF